jgi:hypothetical protein
MVDTEVTCRIFCQLCGWNVGCTITSEENSLFADIIKFLSCCAPQHRNQGTTGKLLLDWQPLDPTSD